jgi:hypothetical protein
MGLGQARTGAPAEGTTVANGTDNDATDPRIIRFEVPGGPVRPCIVMNGTGNGNVIRVKVNTETDGTVSNDFDNDADDDGIGHITIADGETADASFGGLVSVSSVSFITTAQGDDLDLVTVVGWTV